MFEVRGEDKTERDNLMLKNGVKINRERERRHEEAPFVNTQVIRSMDEYGRGEGSREDYGGEEDYPMECGGDEGYGREGAYSRHEDHPRREENRRSLSRGFSPEPVIEVPYFSPPPPPRRESILSVRFGEDDDKWENEDRKLNDSIHRPFVDQYPMSPEVIDIS